MIKKFIIFLIFILFLNNIVLAAATGSDNSNSSKSYYDKAVRLIKSAKEYEAKGKSEKAKKRYKRALRYLLTANKDNPQQADTLNYLGFATRKLGDYKKGEKYYLQGLKIEPKHKGINEYLGELYVVTGRIGLAKERLDVLKNCECEEYFELKEIIDGTKKSKY
tara:strand:+ start:2333 stop:2824 length:492 start_codon:yes stop_codon:yes gene_type:complete